jgi:hypothetical protein
MARRMRGGGTPYGCYNRLYPPSLPHGEPTSGCIVRTTEVPKSPGMSLLIPRPVRSILWIQFLKDVQKGKVCVHTFIGIPMSMYVFMSTHRIGCTMFQ